MSETSPVTPADPMREALETIAAFRGELTPWHAGEAVNLARAALGSASPSGAADAAYREVWEVYKGMCRDDGSGFWHWLAAKAASGAPTPGAAAGTEASETELDLAGVEGALLDMAKEKGGTTGAELERLADVVGQAIGELAAARTDTGREGR